MTDAELIFVRDCVTFSNRFGFLSWEMFRRHVCRESRATQYRKWALLTRENWFVPFQERSTSLFPTAKAKKRFGSSGASPRAMAYHRHDAIVADALAAVSSSGFVVRTWTELELSQQRWLLSETIGSERVNKIPDLIADFAHKGETLRLAVEVELTRKSRARYAHMALSYLEMKHVDGVIFICADDLIRSEIVHSFSGHEFGLASRHAGTALIADVQSTGLESPMVYRSEKYGLREFIELALKFEGSSQPEKETHENRVSEEYSDGLRRSG